MTTDWSQDFSLDFRGRRNPIILEDVGTWETLLPETWNERFVLAFDHAIRSAYRDLRLTEPRYGQLNDIDEIHPMLMPYQAERVGALAFTELFAERDANGRITSNYIGRQALRYARQLNFHVAREAGLDILTENVLQCQYSYELGSVVLKGEKPDGGADMRSFIFTPNGLPYNAIRFTVSSFTGLTSAPFLSYALDAISRYLPWNLFPLPFLARDLPRVPVYVQTVLAQHKVYNGHLLTQLN